MNISFMWAKINSILKIVSHCLQVYHWFDSLLWNFKFDQPDFFPSLNWIFTACVAFKNPVQTKKKIKVYQTGYFKLENVKNQVQIDRRKIWNRENMKNLKSQIPFSVVANAVLKKLEAIFLEKILGFGLLTSILTLYLKKYLLYNLVVVLLHIFNFPLISIFS